MFGSGFKYVLCGDGPDRERVFKQINDLGLKDVVACTGFVDDVYVPLSIAGVFLISGIEDLVGIAGLQAASMGVPVVSYQADPEWQGRNDEYFINATNPEVLAKIIYGLVTDPGYHNDVANKCKRKYDEVFSSAAMSNAYLQLYAELAAADWS